MKNKRVLIIIVVIILVLLLAIGIAFNVRNNKKTPLFVHSYQNYAWGSSSHGYIIYNNGIIEEYNDFDNEKKLKKNKLTEDELEKLEELANKVQDEYKVDNRYQICDAGTTVNKIYNSKLNQWIILDKSGDTNGRNDSNESKEIKELVDRLYHKYIK